MTYVPRRGKTDSDRYFLALAENERCASEDPKARQVPQSAVGAVLVAAGKVVGKSANIIPPPIGLQRRSEGMTDADRYHYIEHAERAAIYTALVNGEDLRGATIYCTRFPCSDCARAIVWAGITRAVFSVGFGTERRWLPAQRAALRMMRDAGLTVRVLPMLSQAQPRTVGTPQS